MLEAFSAYIKNIALFLLFAAFAEMIMPENHLKKYISLVMGLIVLTAVIKPMLIVFQKGGDLEFETLQQTISFWSQEYDIQNVEQQQWNEEMILDIYKTEVEQRIKEDLENEFQIGITNISAEISEKKEEYGSILSVTIITETEKREEMNKYMKKKYEVDNVYIKDS